MHAPTCSRLGGPAVHSLVWAAPSPVVKHCLMHEQHVPGLHMHKRCSHDLLSLLSGPLCS